MAIRTVTLCLGRKEGSHYSPQLSQAWALKFFYLSVCLSLPSERKLFSKKMETKNRNQLERKHSLTSCKKSLNFFITFRMQIDRKISMLVPTKKLQNVPFHCHHLISSKFTNVVLKYPNKKNRLKLLNRNTLRSEHSKSETAKLNAPNSATVNERRQNKRNTHSYTEN